MELNLKEAPTFLLYSLMSSQNLQLKELEKDGIVHREIYKEIPKSRVLPNRIRKISRTNHFTYERLGRNA